MRVSRPNQTFRPRRGQALVEMAVVVPIFLLLVMGIVEGSLAVFHMGRMTQAVQEGARKATLPSTASVDVVKTTVTTSAPFVTAANVTVAVAQINNGPARVYTAREFGDRITVTATYSYTPITAAIFRDGAAFTLTRRTQIMSEGRS